MATKEEKQAAKQAKQTDQLIKAVEKLEKRMVYEEKEAKKLNGRFSFKAAIKDQLPSIKERISEKFSMKGMAGMMGINESGFLGSILSARDEHLKSQKSAKAKQTEDSLHYAETYVNAKKQGDETPEQLKELKAAGVKQHQEAVQARDEIERLTKKQKAAVETGIKGAGLNEKDAGDLKDYTNKLNGFAGVTQKDPDQLAKLAKYQFNRVTLGTQKHQDAQQGMTDDEKDADNEKQTVEHLKILEKLSQKQLDIIQASFDADQDKKATAEAKPFKMPVMSSDVDKQADDLSLVPKEPYTPTGKDVPGMKYRQSQYTPTQKQKATPNKKQFTDQEINDLANQHRAKHPPTTESPFVGPVQPPHYSVWSKNPRTPVEPITPAQPAPVAATVEMKRTGANVAALEDVVKLLQGIDLDLKKDDTALETIAKNTSGPSLEDKLEKKSGGDKTVAAVVEKAKGKGGIESLLEMLKGGLGGIGDFAKGLKSLTPLLGALGTGLALVAAAFVGFKIGDLLNKTVLDPLAKLATGDKDASVGTMLYSNHNDEYRSGMDDESEAANAKQILENSTDKISRKQAKLLEKEGYKIDESRIKQTPAKPVQPVPATVAAPETPQRAAASENLEKSTTKKEELTEAKEQATVVAPTTIVNNNQSTNNTSKTTKISPPVRNLESSFNERLGSSYA